MTSLDTYYLLGRSGLRVSPLALGTMTFGADGWGADEDVSRAMFRHYLDAGGNFVDTANRYALGRSEELLGAFIEETNSRDRVVLATKFTGPVAPGDPNAVGNGRKNMLAALEGSLRRLRTDYVDVYWMHMWDGITPVEEVMATFDAVVRSGKVRAVGLSDVPAWYATKAQMLAAARGWEPVAALQLEYSLVERNIEREQIPAGMDLGMGLAAWSPLGGGLLTGKYTRSGGGAAGTGRLTQERMASLRWMRARTEQDWQIAEDVAAVAKEIGRSPAQVALNWVAHRPGVTSAILGARTMDQLVDNLGALAFTLPEEHAARLEELGRPEQYQPYIMFSPDLLSFFTKGFSVSRTR